MLLHPIAFQVEPTAQIKYVVSVFDTPKTAILIFYVM